jgi:hypothetical protein
MYNLFVTLNKCGKLDKAVCEEISSFPSPLQIAWLMVIVCYVLEFEKGAYILEFLLLLNTGYCVNDSQSSMLLAHQYKVTKSVLQILKIW